MNNEDNVTNFLQELIFLEKDLAQQLKQYQNRQANNAVMHNSIKIDNTLEKILDNLDDPVKRWLAKQNTETKQGQMIINLATNIINLQKTREKSLIEQVQTFIIGTNTNNLKQLQIKEKKIKDLEIELEKNKSNKLCNDDETTNCLVKIPQIKNGIYSITEDNDGNIYCVGNDNNVFKIKNKEVKIIGKIDTNHARAIKYDGLENIFIGTIKGTIYKYNITKENFIKVKEVKGVITTFESDVQHNIYFGTWETGNKDVPGTGRVYKLETNNSLSEIKGTTGSVWSLTIDKNNNIYVGTTEGLFKTDNQINFVKCSLNIPYQNSSIHTIRTIIIDKNENIWIGTREGYETGNIYKCQKGQKQFIKISKKVNGEIFTLAIDSKQNIYAGSWSKCGIGNLFKYDNKINEFGFVSDIPTNLGSIENIFINKNDVIYFSVRLNKDYNSNIGTLYKLKEVCM